MMKKGKISLTLITTLITASMVPLAASSLAELRAEHAHKGQRQYITQKKHKEMRRVREKQRASDRKVLRKRSAKSKTAEMRMMQKRKLSHAKKVQRRIDRKLHRKYAKRRNFRTVRDFRRAHGHSADRRSKRTMRQITPSKRKAFSRDHRRQNRYHGMQGRSHGWHGNDYDTQREEGYGFYESWEPRHTQRGHRYTRRNWYLSYLYERASFYDRHGYKYGYFSRRGFMFEGEFYRYDRQYTYRDRLRGRGLFERRYYRPYYSQFGDFFAEMNRGGSYLYAELNF